MNKRRFARLLPAGAFLVGVSVAQEGATAGSLLLVAFIVMLLILLNAFFVAAEFAIIGVRPSQVDAMAQERRRGAAEVQAILDSPARLDHYIATAQLANSITALGLGMYGEPQIAHFVEPLIAGVAGERFGAGLAPTIASAFALLLLTYLHIVLGEMVPKSISLAGPSRAVLAVHPLMNAFEKLLGPPVSLLNAVGRWLLRLFKIRAAEGEARLHSPEELELIVSESAEGGLLEEDEEALIRNIFDFSDRQVGQVMTPRRKVQAVPSDIPLHELLPLVNDSRHSRFPVYAGDLDHVVGILHLKDLVRSYLRQPEALDLRLITRPAPAVPEDQSVEQMLAAFKHQRIHMAVVLDEFGGLAGIVTLEDLVEEIVGEVRDEFDVEKEPVVELEPGVLDVAGSFLVDDLRQWVFLGEDDDMPDVETIGGLIHTWLGRPPQVGDVVTAPQNSDLRLSVTDVDGLAVARARITFPIMEDDGAAGGEPAAA
ncbi:MAG: hemolysin family protein [Candidatus Promineifilaceae bacterium]